MTNSRADFEQAVEKEWPSRWNFEREAAGDYCGEMVEDMFWAWQASRQALPGNPVAYIEGDDVYFEGQGDINDYIRLHGKPLYADPVIYQGVEGEPIAWVHEKVFGLGMKRFEGRTDCPTGMWAVGMVPLYTHPASAQKDIERWKLVAHDQAETIGELQGLVHASHHEQASVPEGWKLVPVEPSSDMEQAGCQAYMEADGNLWMHPSSMGHAYKAMISASPCVSQSTESAQKAWKHFQSLLGPDDPAKSVSTDRPTSANAKPHRLAQSLAYWCRIRTAKWRR